MHVKYQDGKLMIFSYSLSALQGLGQLKSDHPPQWGAADAEIKVPPGENIELRLKVLPLKPGVDQYIAMHATFTARGFFLANSYPSSPFTCIFSKTSPKIFLC